MTVAEIVSIVMCCCTLASVLVSVWTVRKSGQSRLAEAYFAEVSLSYAGYIAAVNEFTYNSGEPENRDKLSAALLKLQLFSSEKVNLLAQDLYVQLLDWGSSRRRDMLDIDALLQSLQIEMRSDLDHFRKTGNHRLPSIPESK